VLTPAMFYILLALADRERHGYDIMREVARFNGGQVRLGPGTPYRSVRQLLVDGLIAEADERPDAALDDERRRYYRLTDTGARLARAQAERLAQLLDVARTKQLWRDPRRRAAPGAA
jgi:DNA-binding PadR family transcriptional regulator